MLSDNSVYTFAIELDDLRLKVERIIPGDTITNFYTPSIQNKMQTRLHRSLLNTYTVTTGRADLSEYNIITGAHLSEQVIVTIVDEDAHRGVIGKNRFNFQNYDLSEAFFVAN